jgi:putative heme-binding domain-containing protein
MAHKLDRLATRAALRLIGLWKVERFRDRLEGVAKNPQTSAEDRQAALDGLVSLGGEKSKEVLRTLAAPDKPADVRAMATVALAGLDLPAAAEQAASLLSGPTPPADPTGLVAAFTGRKGGPAALAAALAGKKLPADVARLGVRAARAAGQPDPKLVAAFTTAGGLTEAKRTLAGKELEQFLADLPKLGDPARGEQVFRRDELKCLTCHSIAGAGGVVGAEMTSIGASAQPDYLVESLLDPSAKIKEGYHSLIVTTVDDRVFTGIKVKEANGQLVLRDAEDRETVIPVADIVARKDGKSLMPEGLVDSLTRQELLDLTRFLSELGKGAYASTPGKVVRRWEVLHPTKDLFTVIYRDRLAGVTNPAAKLFWSPAYSLVSGDLPPDAVPVWTAGKDVPRTSVARFQVEATTAGPVKLTVNDPAGLTVWVDGTPLDPARGVVDLSQGTHTVSVAVDVAARSKPLRVELDEVPSSPARARVVGGK